MTAGRLRIAMLVALGALGAAAVAQDDTDSSPEPEQTGLNIPSNIQIFGKDDPAVRKATAIVNGDIITDTDIDQRLNLVIAANNAKIPDDERERLRLQVLRNLIDESLEIQEAKSNDITIDNADVDSAFARVSGNFKQTPQQFADYLKSKGSSQNSLKRQIRGELAWQRVLGRKVEPLVNVGDDEVKAVIDRLNAAKGTQEYRVGEIYLSSTPDTDNDTLTNATKIVQQVRGGASFVAYARQFSEASTAAVGGDLGWVRAEQLPDALATTIKAMGTGTVSDPIHVPGGYSIVALVDKRQVLMSDPRDATLSLKQISIAFPAGMTQAQAAPKVDALARATENVGGCGKADAVGKAIGADVVQNDQVHARDLPPLLQDMVLKLSIGQSTRPFGSVKDGVRVLVLCGRDDAAENTGPSFDQVYAQLNEERVNRRARRYLRDLRRDAVVDYR